MAQSYECNKTNVIRLMKEDIDPVDLYNVMKQHNPRCLKGAFTRY